MKSLFKLFQKHPILALLLLIFLSEFIFLAINPYNRQDWLLENMLVFIFVVLVLLNYKKYKLSTMSWVMLFIFFFLHEIGSHYTYAKVPYNEFLLLHFDFNLNHFMGWSRNNFDRIIHLAFGLLIVIPIHQLCCQISRSNSNWTYFVALNIIIATSSLYELIEWAAALVFGGDLGVAYLGTQGDIWDAHKDMVLADVGAFFALTVKLIYRNFIQTRSI
jgi:putative membrane protein